jgi:hypothetical protein
MRSRALLPAAALTAGWSLTSIAAATSDGPDAGRTGKFATDSRNAADAGPLPDAGIWLTPEEQLLLLFRSPDAGTPAGAIAPRPRREPIVLVRDIAPAPGPTPEARPTRVLLRTVVGLVAVVGLAYVAAHPRARALERRLGMLHRITAGLGFVLIGVLAREAQIFTQHVLTQLTPVLHVGLGWLGFQLGYRVDVRRLDQMPPGTARDVTLVTVFPLLLITACCGSIAYLLGVRDVSELATTALALGFAGAISTAPVRTETPSDDGRSKPPEASHQLDEIASVIGLGLLSC